VTQYRFDGSVRNAIGQAIPGVEVFVCTQPLSSGAGVIPPTPLALLYANAAGPNAASLSSAFYSGGYITFVFSAPPPADVVDGSFISISGASPAGYNGIWQVVSVSGNNITVVLPFETFAPNPGAYVSGGTVATSALPNPILTDGNGNFFFYTATGIYTLVYFDTEDRIVTQFFPDQTVLAPGGGSVSSVAMTGDGVVQNSVVPGSPVVGSGTLAPTVRTVAANLVVAGPASGSPGPLTTRPLVTADLPASISFGTVAVPFNAVPAFNAALFAEPTFLMTLTGNVTSSSVTGATAGQTINFVITQDGTGGRTFAWPSNFKGASAIGPDPSSVSVQSFVFDGTNWRAIGAGSVTGS
jgi:hypothetical protein